ncbi:Brain-specific serine protease 4 [Pseudolycoriella hygida]|uniref:Brain-specific serine protease 4 n=1 Tax=Pseudolycoriella hygida TaxID=35572 RepID=A0A9Q0ML49_9DIPT|nr:Brain-specific serine protease 4 [Pseudolycoriella hygida]
MFKTVVVVLLASFVAFAQSQNAEDILPLVTGGTATVRGDAPSVVSIRRPVEVAQDTNIYCSGVIVNANHIVTAASCVHNTTFHLVNPFWFRIIAGDLNILLPSYQRFTTRATHIYTHPNYGFNPPRNNIAVMRTLDPFPVPHNTIDFAVRNTRILPIGQVCRFIGWGSQTDTGAINVVQMSLNAPIIDRACGGVVIVDNMLCAGTMVQNSGVCTGNIGGGLFCDVDGWWEFTGVLAGGLGCGAPNIAGLYMQVREFNTWINQQFTRTDATNPGILVQTPPA